MTDEKKAPSNIEAFTFGEPTPVLDSRELMDYAEAYLVKDYYEPPTSFAGLAKSFRANAHHASAIYVKRNILSSSYIPHPLLSRTEFSAWALDYLTMGNGFLERIDNLKGDPLKLRRSPAKQTRRLKGEGKYAFLKNFAERHDFMAGSVHHLLEPDINQEVYGVPEYMASLQSAWLNESATLFRRKYYLNGSHAGFIMYMTDAAQDKKDVDALRNAMKGAKGPGNFKNLFMYAPNGKKDGIQILPISEVQAKDEFFNIKNVTRDDVLAAHRVPPHLMGIIPNNSAGFGSAEAAAKVFARNEIQPLQERFMELNDWLGIEVIQFKPYQIELSPTE